MAPTHNTDTTDAVMHARVLSDAEVMLAKAKITFRAAKRQVNRMKFVVKTLKDLQAATQGSRAPQEPRP